MLTSRDCLQSWFDRAYPHLSLSGLWLRGATLNTLAPEEYERRSFRILFARLSTWGDTGVSLTHRVLYRIAVNTEQVFADIAYLPTAADAAVFAQDDIPWLLGAHSLRGAAAFDCIAFTNSAAQELINLPHMLARSGIPLTRSERMSRSDIPLIILGGANAASAAGLLRGDSLVDAVFAGGDESAIEKLMSALRDAKRDGLTKSETLRKMSDVTGFADCGAEHAHPVRAASGPEPSAAGVPVEPHVDQMGAGHVAVSDGCPYGCSFCFECWAHRPYRERDPGSVCDEALNVRRTLAAESIELYGYSVNAHARLGDILAGLATQCGSIGLKSQRLDMLASHPAILDAFRAVGKGSVTVGLEGISARLRRFLDKQLPSHSVQSGLAALFDAGMREVKVFLIVTGHESNEDFEEFERLLAFISDYRQRSASLTKIIFSATPLVCFPHTPFEFAQSPQPANCAKILQRLSHSIWRAKLEYRDAATPTEQSVTQALARPFDSRVVAALTTAVLDSGFVYYTSITPAFTERFFEELARVGVSRRDSTSAPPADSATDSPWSFIDMGVPREQLLARWKQCEQALDQQGESGERELFEGRESSVSAPHVARIRERLSARRDRSIEIAFNVDIGERGRLVPRKMVALALAHALIDARPALAASWDGYRSSLWVEDNELCTVTGRDVLVTAWQKTALASVTELCADSSLLALDSRWAKVNGVCDPRAAFDGTLVFVSPFEQRIDRFLENSHLAATRRSTGDGAYVWECNKQSLKKDIVRSVRFEPAPGGCALTVTPGKRFAVRDFLSTAFALPSAQEQARITVRAGLNAPA